MQFDLTDIGVRSALFHFHNRRHDGEVWLWVRQLGRIFPVEQSHCPEGAEVLGEIESKIVGDRFVDEIVPMRQRSVAEIEVGQRSAEAHKRFRVSLYKSYSISARL